MDFDKQFNRTATKMVAVGVVGNLVFWGGLIYLGFWCAERFGLIGG